MIKENKITQFQKIWGEKIKLELLQVIWKVYEMKILLTCRVFKKLNYNIIKQYKISNFLNKMKTQVLQLLLGLEKKINIKSNLKSTSLITSTTFQEFFPANNSIVL